MAEKKLDNRVIDSISMIHTIHTMTYTPPPIDLKVLEKRDFEPKLKGKYMVAYIKVKKYELKLNKQKSEV